jgi:HSP20 family protein
MSMELWDPYREMSTLRDAMSQLFQESFVRPSTPFRVLEGRIPVDIAETENHYEVRAVLPGLRPEDVQITVRGDTVAIRGEIKSEQERKDKNWITREQRTGTFYRSVTLPSPVNADQAEARYENGVLILTLPKTAEARPKQIKVAGTREGEMGQGQAPPPEMH